VVAYSSPVDLEMLLKVAKIHANWGSTQVFNAVAFLVSSDLSGVGRDDPWTGRRSVGGR
jgi:hypothetical protein